VGVRSVVLHPASGGRARTGRPPPPDDDGAPGRHRRAHSRPAAPLHACVEDLLDLEWLTRTTPRLLRANCRLLLAYCDCGAPLGGPGGAVTPAAPPPAVPPSALAAPPAASAATLPLDGRGDRGRALEDGREGERGVVSASCYSCFFAFAMSDTMLGGEGESPKCARRAKRTPVTILLGHSRHSLCLQAPPYECAAPRQGSCEWRCCGPAVAARLVVGAARS